MTRPELIHHSAAACSSSHTLLWISEDSKTSSVVYSSHGIINICQSFEACLSSDGPIDVEETVWSVVETLRTSSCGESSTKRIITAICSLLCTSTGAIMGLASGFSDGTVNVWRRKRENNQKDEWTEQILQASGSSLPITDMDGIIEGEDGNFMVVVATSKGAFLLTTGDPDKYVLAKFAVNTVNLQHFRNQTILLLGTAAPRNNKIHIFWFDRNHINEDEATSIKSMKPVHVGYLVGHEDWLTDFAWDLSTDSNPILASGSQDARIRLWDFKTTHGEKVTTYIREEVDINNEEDNEFDAAIDQDDDEGEARLEIFHSEGVTRVMLETLLYGHEEAITSVEWHPQPQALYKKDRILLSSSMDRTILIWSSSDESGIWSPLTRVGAAGGILGGSIGSTLLGFLGLAVEPLSGDSLLGHAYGGALHFWSLQRNQIMEEETMTSDELVLGSQWKATACITGHFNSVTDCCWEASEGEYLLTVSNDQTCRLWGAVATRTEGKEVWVELARPQVHGYDLTTLTSISTSIHRHIIVTGADEKEIRVFDAPSTCTKMLEHTLHKNMDGVIRTVDIGLNRVERAYIPSLGLSNKPSSADSAKEDTEDVIDNEFDSKPHLPLERDLGAVSLWPEVGKLYGHDTEIFCLTSTLTAKSSKDIFDSPFADDILVASSTKARDVKDATIRIWQVSRNKCMQVLSGHKSTIAALSFSPDGRFLASSGKDRRLCIWERRHNNESKDDNYLFMLAVAVDTAHKRIIWAVHFCPFDPTLLASGSRDGIVKLWRLTEVTSEQDGKSMINAALLMKFQSSSKNEKKKSQPVTALSFAPLPNNEGESLLAIGLENGLIEIWGVGGNSCRLLNAFIPGLCHFATITKLCWKPQRGDEEQLILASTSADHGCRIFTILIN